MSQQTGLLEMSRGGEVRMRSGARRIGAGCAGVRTRAVVRTPHPSGLPSTSHTYIMKGDGRLRSPTPDPQKNTSTTFYLLPQALPPPVVWRIS
jgi:hypothetical protein